MGEAEHYHQMLEKLAWVEMTKKDFLAKLKKKNLDRRRATAGCFQKQPHA